MSGTRKSDRQEGTLVVRKTAMGLMQIAMLGAGHLMRSEVERVLDGMFQIEDQFDEIALTVSTIRRMQREDEEARLVLERFLRRKPDAMRAKSLLGSLLYRMGEKRWKTLLEDVVKDGSDKLAVELANSVLMIETGR